MKPTRLLGVLIAVISVSTGCTDREPKAQKVKTDVEAKARAEAARKEMSALPKAFKSPQFFKLNEADKKAAPAPVPEQPKPKP